ncbi:DNA cytosine methyltransferase [Paenibacillus naphthalenovorans]|uniref:DNA cytosine methyltransferase n=1 Tax=Paenibacillus naphthalenovorans TaxID=162209 RepID=UPI003D2C8CDC
MEFTVTPQLPSNGLTVAELFCGGGLMAVGLKAAGYTLTWANDFDKNAAKAYAANIGDHVICGDITSDSVQSTIPDADIFAGGPPCQDYSVAGSGAGENGERGRLVWTYLSIIERKQPKAFVFENVKGLVLKRHKQTFDALLERFDSIGYNVSWRLINAWDYGVAQKRERVFIVGIRKDLGFTFEFPEPEASGYRTQVLRDVIGDLPEPGTPLSNAQQAYLDRNPASVAKNRPVEMTEPSRTLPGVLAKGVPYGLFYPENHVGSKATSIPPSKHDTPSALDEPSKTIVASTTGGKNAFYPENHDEKSFWTPKREYTYDQANRVQSMDAASKNTIPAHHNSGQPIHQTQAPRRFTVRECLRIQSAPDSYVLPADISLSAQYRIVGNGVASRVAYVIGNALATQLNAILANSNENEAV